VLPAAAVALVALAWLGRHPDPEQKLEAQTGGRTDGPRRPLLSPLDGRLNGSDDAKLRVHLGVGRPAISTKAREHRHLLERRQSSALAQILGRARGSVTGQIA
jgi:hypothetical protein